MDNATRRTVDTVRPYKGKLENIEKGEKNYETRRRANEEAGGRRRGANVDLGNINRRNKKTKKM